MRMAVFASGNGSNAEEIIRYFKGKEIEIGLVVCNRKEAGVYERAARYGIAAVHVPKSAFNEAEYMTGLLTRYGIDFIVLAGFLLMIPEYLLRLYPNRIVNIHPSLLPKYGGKGMYGERVHEAVAAAGEKETGITIHMVSEECDGGEIVFQAATGISPSDTPADIAGKVHELEYLHYPRVIEEVVKRIVLEG